MGQPVVHWEIASRDAGALRAFYQELFDWKVTVDETLNYGIVETGGVGGIDGGIYTAPESSPTHLTFYVQVDDLNGSLSRAETLGALSRAETLGAKILVPPTTILGVGMTALFADPEGNPVGLFTGQTAS